MEMRCTSKASTHSAMFLDSPNETKQQSGKLQSVLSFLLLTMVKSLTAHALVSAVWPSLVAARFNSCVTSARVKPLLRRRLMRSAAQELSPVAQHRMSAVDPCSAQTTCSSFRAALPSETHHSSKLRCCSATLLRSKISASRWASWCSLAACRGGRSSSRARRSLRCA